mmetsp:Transcript_9584/g.21690  ORF Transcript_9584/g.21690 Transcript_9584/m.21690 type:complete len:360 (-) Transcript_9584:414-1493(-)
MADHKGPPVEGSFTTFMLLGSSLTLGGLGMWLLAEFKMVPIPPSSMFQPMCAAISLGGIPLFGLSVAPSDKRTARAWLHFLTSLSAVLVLTFTVLSVRFSRACCDSPLQKVYLTLSLSLTTIGCVSFALFSLAYDKSPRAAVEHCWLVGRGVGITLSAVYLCYAALRVLVDPNCSQERFVAQLLLAFAPLCYVALTGPKQRRRLQLWCGSATDGTLLPDAMVHLEVSPPPPSPCLPFDRKEDEEAFRSWWDRMHADYKRKLPLSAGVGVCPEEALRQAWLTSCAQEAKMADQEAELGSLRQELEDAQSLATKLEKIRHEELLARTIRNSVVAANRYYVNRLARPRQELEPHNEIPTGEN